LSLELPGTVLSVVPLIILVHGSALDLGGVQPFNPEQTIALESTKSEITSDMS